jgi:ribonuclease R
MKYKPKELEKMAIHLSQRERVAQKASRDSVKYKQCEYLSDKLGVIYTGVVTSVQDYGMFVEIIENGCESLVKLNSDWLIDVRLYKITNLKTNQIIKLGDEVKVIIKSVDLERKEINLVILDIY